MTVGKMHPSAGLASCSWSFYPLIERIRPAFPATILPVLYLTLYLSASIFEERVMTTPYYRQNHPEQAWLDVSLKEDTAVYFRFPLLLNGIQFLFNALFAGLYVLCDALSTASDAESRKPRLAAIPPLLFVTLANNFGSQLGSAALAHVDYSALLISKSCMLVPVVILNVVLLQKQYPAHRYFLFLAVTFGLVLFTAPDSSIKERTYSYASWARGSLLLLSNLFLDGSTYIVLEHIGNHPHRYGALSGPYRMLILNITATTVTFTHLILPQVPLLRSLHLVKSKENLAAAFDFVGHHPAALYDIVKFATASALAQMLLYIIFREFSSLLQVQIRVVRKTLSMLLSLIWFRKCLAGRQLVGAILVFGAISLEASTQKGGASARKKRKTA